ncbi:MAG: hypothetical protein QXE85_00020 [Nitrososphaerota archaeon]
MSVHELLAELLRTLQRIPTVETGETVEPEHHNLLTDAVALLYEIALKLSAPPILALTPAGSREISSSQPYSIIIPLGQFPGAQAPGLPLPFKCRVTSLYTVIHSNNLNVNINVELQKNGQSTGASFTIPSNSGPGVWGCTCDVRFDANDCLRALISPAETPTQGSLILDMLLLYIESYY